MPFALLVIGVVLVTVAVRNTQQDFIKLVKGDFTGPANFIYWIVALVIIGSLGYIKTIKPISDGLLVIVLLVLFLSKGNPAKNQNGGFFQQFTTALKGTTAAGSSSSGGSNPFPIVTF